MSFVAVAIGGSALVGAGASIIGGNAAAGAQKDASAAATALQEKQLAETQREYDQNRSDLAPYRDAGYTALGQIGAGTASGGEFNTPYTAADLPTDPGYQFRLAEGNRGVAAASASRGGVLSGGTLKALARYNQGEASQEYGAAFARNQTDLTGRYNRLASLAGVGQTATNSTIAASEANNAAQQTGTSAVASNILAAGNATASSYANAGKSVANGVNSAVGNYISYLGT